MSPARRAITTIDLSRLAAPGQLAVAIPDLQGGASTHAWRPLSSTVEIAMFNSSLHRKRRVEAMRMTTNKRLALTAGFGAVLSCLSLNAAAGAPRAEITVSWALQSGSTPVPTLGAYSAVALALLVALIVYRTFSGNPRLMGALLVTGVALSAASGALWVKSSVAGIPITAVTGSDCNSSTSFPETSIAGIENNCSGPVTVTYELQSTANCPTLSDLSCVESDTPCVDDGGTVAVGQSRIFLSCRVL